MPYRMSRVAPERTGLRSAPRFRFPNRDRHQAGGTVNTPSVLGPYKDVPALGRTPPLHFLIGDDKEFSFQTVLSVFYHF